jgi:hypothetical protein
MDITQLTEGDKVLVKGNKVYTFCYANRDIDHLWGEHSVYMLSEFGVGTTVRQSALLEKVLA